MANVNELILKSLQAGKSKNDILVEIVRADPAIDLVKAGQLYAEVGKKAGLIMDNETRKKSVTTAVNAHIGGGETGERTLDREAAVAELIAKGFSKGAAVSNLKAACAEQKIIFPQATRQKRDMEKVNTAYRAWVKDGVSREQIEKGLVQHFGYGKNSVGSAYVKIGRDLGLIEKAQHGNRKQMAEWFADPKNVEGDKKAVVARIKKDHKVADATADTRYAIYLFAKEYHAAMTVPVG